MLYDQNGMPLAWAYGACLANRLDYTRRTGGGDKLRWYPAAGGERGGPYDAHVEATQTDFAAFSHHSTFRVYLLDANHIHCRMLGVPFPEEDLFAMIEAMKPLPYSAAVARALIDKADWLDENPMYRGIPVKQGKKKVAPAQLEVG